MTRTALAIERFFSFINCPNHTESRKPPFKYSEHTSPSKLSFFLSYSYSEDCENLKQMSVNLYAKVLYALSPKTVFDWKKYLSLPVNAVMIINPVSEKR